MPEITKDVKGLNTETEEDEKAEGSMQLAKPR
jgi:hypothetical protein